LEDEMNVKKVRTETIVNQVHGRLERLKVADLKSNALQPLHRITTSAIQQLDLNVVQTGIIAPPVISRMKHGELIVVDGHRRLEVAKNHKLKTLQCYVIENQRDPKILFMHLNLGLRSIKGQDWLYVWAKSDPKDRPGILKIIGTKIRGQIERMRDTLGEQRTVGIGLKGTQSPGFMDAVWVLSSTFTRMRIQHDSRKVAEWILLHGLQRWVWNNAQTKFKSRIFLARTLEHVEQNVHPIAARRRKMKLVKKSA